MPSVNVSLPSDVYEQVKRKAEESGLKLSTYLKLLATQDVQVNSLSRKQLLAKRLKLIDEQEKLRERFGKTLNKVGSAYASLGGVKPQTPEDFPKFEEGLKKLYSRHKELGLKITDVIEFETYWRKVMEIIEISHTLAKTA